MARFAAFWPDQLEHHTDPVCGVGECQGDAIAFDLVDGIYVCSAHVEPEE